MLRIIGCRCTLHEGYITLQSILFFYRFLLSPFRQPGTYTSGTENTQIPAQFFGTRWLSKPLLGSQSMVVRRTPSWSIVFLFSSVGSRLWISQCCSCTLWTRRLYQCHSRARQHRPSRTSGGVELPASLPSRIRTCILRTFLN